MEELTLQQQAAPVHQRLSCTSSLLLTSNEQLAFLVFAASSMREEWRS
jgi:hypothetical protein